MLQDASISAQGFCSVLSLPGDPRGVKAFIYTPETTPSQRKPSKPSMRKAMLPCLLAAASADTRKLSNPCLAEPFSSMPFCNASLTIDQRADAVGRLSLEEKIDARAQSRARRRRWPRKVRLVERGDLRVAGTGPRRGWFPYTLRLSRDHGDVFQPDALAGDGRGHREGSKARS